MRELLGTSWSAGMPPILIQPAEPILIEPLAPIVVWPAEPTLVLPVEPLLISPPARPLWDERGWKRRADHEGVTYLGEYLGRAPHDGAVHRFPGRIEQRGRGTVHAFVQDPPPGLRRHPKGACFHLVGAGPWFSINWLRPTSSPDAAIAYIEQVLTESLAR